MKHWIYVSTLLLSSAIAASATTTIVIDNGAPNQADVLYFGNRLIAQDFYLPAPTNFVYGTFWDLIYNGDASTTITLDVAIYRNASNMPGTVVYAASGVSPTQTYLGQWSAISSFAEFRNVIALPNIALPAGTYWFAVGNVQATTYGKQTYWETTSPNGTLQTTVSDGSGGWLQMGTEYAFNLESAAGTGTVAETSAVPEPGTVSLLAAGLGLIATGRLTRRRMPRP